jgi:hypothetical protein
LPWPGRLLPVQASPLPVIGGPYEFPHWLVDASQVVGAAGTVVAIGLAALALFRAETVAARERRIAHELEVLRDMAELMFEQVGPSEARKLGAMLLMLRDWRDFPLTRTALGVEPISVKARREFYRRYPDAPPLDDDSPMSTAMGRLKLVRKDRTSMDEWSAAVARRVHLEGPIGATRYVLRGWRIWGDKAHRRWATTRPSTRPAASDERADDEQLPPTG